MLYRSLFLDIFRMSLCFSTHKYQYLSAQQRKHFLNHRHIGQTNLHLANTCQSYFLARLPAIISQGTVFLHFKTKEKLLKKIIVEELLTLKEQLEFTELNLSSLFRLVEDHEEILSRVIKDYPYLPSSFQEVFDQLKSSLKDHLFDILKETSNQSILDLFAFIDLLLALLFEDLFYSREKILSTRKKKYKQMIQKFT